MSCSKERKVGDYYNHDYKRDHQGNLAKICILCYKKCKGKVMNDNHKNIFRGRVFKDYDLYSEFLPCGICNSCATLLLSKGKIDFVFSTQENFIIHKSYLMTDKDEEDNEKPKKDKFYFRPDYEALARHVREIVNAPSLRSHPRDEFHCICDTCFRATFKGKVLPPSDFQSIQRSKAGGSRSDAKEDTSDTPGTSGTSGTSGSSSSSTSKKSVLKCRECWSEIAPGKHQTCNKDKR